MFGFSIITRTERLLWQHTIETQQARIDRLEEQVRHEQKRAEAAINALLAKKANLVLTPEPTAAETDRQVVQFDEVLQNTFGLFDDDPEKLKREADILERLQS